MHTDRAATLRIALIFLFLLGALHPAAAGDLPQYALAPVPVPVFSTGQSATPGQYTMPDRCGQIRQLEFIALPGTVFKIVSSVANNPQVLQVSTSDYLPRRGVKLYAAKALLKLQDTLPPDRSPIKPLPETVQKQLRSSVGLPYIWGGNLPEGITQEGRKRFAGLDCSGLLYAASGGYTPRNTDQLLHFGTAVPIEGLGVDEILSRIRPLDLIVWMGHVIIVLDHETAIESILGCKSGNDGVILTPLKDRLEQVMKKRQPVNSWPQENKKTALFVVRRWL